MIRWYKLGRLIVLSWSLGVCSHAQTPASLDLLHAAATLDYQHVIELLSLGHAPLSVDLQADALYYLCANFQRQVSMFCKVVNALKKHGCTLDAKNWLGDSAELHLEFLLGELMQLQATDPN